MRGHNSRVFTKICIVMDLVWVIDDMRDEASTSTVLGWVDMEGEGEGVLSCGGG